MKRKKWGRRRRMSTQLDWAGKIARRIARNWWGVQRLSKYHQEKAVPLAQALRDAHDKGVVRSAKAICLWCRQGEERIADKGYWTHAETSCDAFVLYDLLEARK